MMQLHQQRVINEKSELSEKLSKLESFLSSPLFSTISGAEQAKLSRQFLIMQLYEQVLSERISAF